MKILGINFEQHDSGASLIIDGEIIASVNEERFSRNKMDNSAPIKSVQYCLDSGGITPSEIDHIVFSGYPPLKKMFYFGNHYRKLALFTNMKNLFFFMFSDKGKFHFWFGIKALFVNLMAITGIPSFYKVYLKKRIQIKKKLFGFKGKTSWVSHHVGHLSSAYYTSGQNECLSVVVEGTDWKHTMVIDHIKDGKITQICATPWPHSAGSFYELITMLLGFNLYLHAGKITGLASYGNPETCWEKVRKLMWTEGMELRISPLVYSLRNDFLKNNNMMPSFFSGYSKEDLAAAFQQRLEECVSKIVSMAVENTGVGHLVMSGGVCANVKLNQRIHELDGVKSIYVHPAMSDAGQALGVSLSKAAQIGDIKDSLQLSNVFLGPDYSGEEIEKSLKDNGLEYTKKIDINEHVAQLLSEEKIVARFTGRIEYGPRALGNRSILYQTTDPSINDWLNKRLKRTEFMPFAPVSLFEERDKLYLNTKGAEYTSNFMTITFNCTEWMKKNCPAVVHVDGTARPQFVDEKNNPDLYEIVKKYHHKTGIPAIINTSFNMHGEPIVLSPSDAIRSFLNGRLDYLAIGAYIVKHPILI